MQDAQDAGRTEDEMLGLIKSWKPKARNKKDHRKTREQAAGNNTDGQRNNTPDTWGQNVQTTPTNWNTTQLLSIYKTISHFQTVNL